MKGLGRNKASSVSVANFRDDPIFPKIERIVGELLANGNVVMPVDVIIGMGLLQPEHLETWRFGRVPYLERVINCRGTRPTRPASASASWSRRPSAGARPSPAWRR